MRESDFGIFMTGVHESSMNHESFMKVYESYFWAREPCSKASVLAKNTGSFRTGQCFCGSSLSNLAYLPPSWRSSLVVS